MDEEVQRQGQGRAHHGDVFPALVLGADDGTGRRQMLQALDPQPEEAAQGLPRQPAAQEIKIGGKRTGHCWEENLLIFYLYIMSQ